MRQDDEERREKQARTGKDKQHGKDVFEITQQQHQTIHFFKPLLVIEGIIENGSAVYADGRPLMQAKHYGGDQLIVHLETN